MQVEKNRRRWIRRELDPPQIGILVTEDQEYQTGTNLINKSLCLYVDLLNKSSGGVAVKLQKGLACGSTFYLNTFNHRRNTWQSFRGAARWTRQVSETSADFLMGAECLKLKENDKQVLPGSSLMSLRKFTPKSGVS